ncbi:MAG TPA: carbohydrate ABC transporter permease [Acholeplasmataceae bacterium]|nr:carbohydrate ABC transporter permease [Acholeplasmataceae bacterium]
MNANTINNQNQSINKTKPKEKSDLYTSKIRLVIRYTILILVSFVMLYPLVWMIGNSFNLEMPSSFSFIPKKWTFEGWQNALKAPGWGSEEGYSMFRALWNTLSYTIPNTIFTTITCLITAYVVSRFNFKGKKLVFTVIIATLLMPNTIFRIPLYAFWTSKTMSGLWEGSNFAIRAYIPLWSGAMFAIDSFSTFMFIQFFRTIPRDLDEAAYIDGANRMQILWHIFAPILKPTIITVALLKFISSFNDYQGPLIYNSSVKTQPLSLVLPQLGVDSINTYSMVYSRAIIAALIPVIVFFVAQKYFMGSDTDSAIKG